MKKRLAWWQYRLQGIWPVIPKDIKVVIDEDPMPVVKVFVMKDGVPKRMIGRITRGSNRIQRVEQVIHIDGAESVGQVIENLHPLKQNIQWIISEYRQTLT